MSEHRHPVVVVGGGVIGLTVAVALELAGHPTLIFSDGRDIVTSAAPSADVATLHAAASILPHSVRGPRTASWARVTTAVLDAVTDDPSWGVRVQTHMEIFEAETMPQPAYRDALDGFVTLDPSFTVVPRRHANTPICGWSFDVRFCEGPTYVGRLAAEYLNAGGRFLVGKPATLIDLVAAGAHHVVNCAGHAGRGFAADAAGVVDDLGADLDLDPLVDGFDTRYVIGHYLRVRRPGMLRGPDGRVLSYNYSPTREVYSNAAGEPADVYCYPRSDAWLLGGSRICVEGDLKAAHYRARRLEGDVVTVPDADGRGLRVPRQILDLNHDLIAHYTQGSIKLKEQLARYPASVWAGYGFRAERSDPIDSTRVSCSAIGYEHSRALVAHCYGHGGSGFTLSWGCAIDLVRQMRLAVERTGLPQLPRVASTRSHDAGLLGDVVRACIDRVA